MRAGKRQSHPNYRAMGFLSRKKKPEPVIEDTHPLEEELKGMEEAVPEPQYVDSDDLDAGAPAAGPVADEYSSSSQAAGEEHPSAPPADEEPTADAPDFEPPLNQAPVEQAPPAPVAEPQIAPAEPEVAVNASPASVEDDEAEGGGRMKAIDLIAPTRLDFLKPEPVEPEAPVDQPDVIAFANQK